MSVKKWYGGRAMLNRKGFQSTASMVAEIENTEGGADDDRYRAPTYTLQFANCDRSISFEVEMHSKEGRANSLYKIKLMVKLLTEFQKGLEAEIRRMEVREKNKRY